MKSIVLLGLIVFGIMGCDESYYGATQSRVHYMQDPRTKLCFATGYYDRGPIFSHVPCETVPSYLLEMLPK